MLGTILTGVFVSAAWGGVGLAEGVPMSTQVGIQVIGVLTTVVWCCGFTYLILKVVDRLNGLRLTEDDEESLGN